MKQDVSTNHMYGARASAFDIKLGQREGLMERQIQAARFSPRGLGVA